VSAAVARVVHHGSATTNAYRALDLEAHALLAGVPLHDVHAVDLPGGGSGRTLADVRSVVPIDEVMRTSPLTRLLFGARLLLGRLLGWDREPSELPGGGLAARLPAELRARSERLPGTADGPFRLVYLLPTESLSEIRNATVHAFLCAALEPVDGGYRLYWAVYVRPVSRFTRVYMAAIDPFRRGIVYPAMLGRIRRAWIDRAGAPAATPTGGEGGRSGRDRSR